MSVRSVAAEVLALVALGVLLWGCDRGEVTEPVTETTPVKASDWIEFVNWDTRTVVTVTMVESSPGGPLSYSPNALTFEAGKPYVLRIVSPGSNAEKHYFSPDGAPDFYQAIAVRKIETSQAEYKAAYFGEVEMMRKSGGATLDLYFVPVLAGTYGVYCKIPGHRERGMVGQITITGGAGYKLDLEVAPDFNQALATDSRKSGSHAVWAAAVDTTVRMFETAAFDKLGFVPPSLELKQGVGYKIHLTNQAGHKSKHYYTAAGFYKTVVLRKAEDSNAEIKAPYLKAIELMIGGEATLFMVPTREGSFEVVCTIPGHADLGMKGTITVR